MISRDRFNSITNSFTDKNILVVGDVMLDRYYFGNSDRMSPEAPVPIVDIDKVVDRLGGSSNVALNLSTLGANPTLCGAIGDDLDGEILKEKLIESKISTDFVITASDRPTTVKSRIISKDHQVVRMDREATHDFSKDLNNQIIASLSDAITGFDAIILQDYNKGLLNKESIPIFIEMSKNNSIPIYVDPKHKNFDLYTGVRLFKPNISEFNNFLEESKNFEDDAFLFSNQIKSEVLLITKGADGSSMFHENEHYSIPTKAQNVHDVSGAGDTVISTFCLSDICGASPQESAYLSNFAAGRVCEEVGVVPIALEMLKEIYLSLET